MFTTHELDNQTNMQLNYLAFTFCFVWGKHDMPLYFTVSWGSLLLSLSLLRILPEILLHLRWSVFEHKAFVSLTDHTGLWLLLCMHLYSAVKNISTTGNRAQTPSPLLAIVMLPVCKQTTWVFRGPMRPGEEKKMGGKLEGEEKLGSKHKDRAG